MVLAVITDIVAGAFVSFSSVREALTTTVSSYFCGSSGGLVGCWVLGGCGVVGGVVGCWAFGGWVAGCCAAADCGACPATSGAAARTTPTVTIAATRQTSFIHAPLNPETTAGDRTVPW